MAIFELGLAQVIFWALNTVALGAAVWVVYSGQYRNPQHDRELAWLIWHCLTGGPLETTRSYPGGGGRPRRLARRTSKAVARTGLGVGFLAAVYLQSGASYGPGPGTASAAGGSGVVILAVGTILIAHVAVEWSMWRHYMRPLHWAVAGAAGWPLDIRWWQVRRYIRIPRGLASGGDGVVVACGPTFRLGTDAEEKVEEIVKAKLGMSDVSVSWKREGIHRYVQFVRQEPVPERVPFRNPETRALIEEESTPGTVLLGLTRGGAPVWLDIDRKAPHVLMSAGTGGGKTAALVAIVAQLMWHGAKVVVLDFKRLSHLWLRDLAGVRYARDIDEIHRTAVELGAEVDRRTKAWDDVTFDEREAGGGPTFPRLVIVCEEMSSTMDYLRDHWSDIKQSGDPARSPAVTALAKVLNMGREVRMNVLTVAQRAEANAVGNGAMRENYPVRILIDRYSKQTWTILAPECEYRPGVAHAGRAQVCIGATATETQLLWITQREAQRWVLDKRGMQPLKPPAAVPADAASPGETGRGSRGSAAAGVTLWEASKDKGRGIVGMTYSAIRSDRLRHPVEFPEPSGRRGDTPEYDVRDLQRWEQNRTRPMASDEVAGGHTGNERDEVERVDTRERESAADDFKRAWLQPGAPRRGSDRERFWGQVDRSDPDGCWLWTGAANGDGYGYFKVAGRAVAVHRFGYEDQVGPIPAGETIDHRIGPGEPCTSKLCVRGDHLQAVTNQRNVELRHERDRARQGAAG